MKRYIYSIIITLIVSVYIVHGQSVDQNYIKTTTYLDSSAISSMEVIQYYDGLGRPVETVHKQGSPSRKDIINLIEYDQFGRANKEWLPVAATNSTGQYYSPAAVKSRILQSEIYNDGRPCTQIIYENSPLHRVEKVFGPGQNWYDNNKSVQYKYRTNTWNGTPFYTFSDEGGIISVSRAGYYPESTMFILETIDEDGNSFFEHKDKQGRVVFTQNIRKEREDAWNRLHNTAYIYDDFGRLRVVLPPSAVDRLETGATWTENSQIFMNYAYGYKYDARGNCIWKKLPGAAPVYYVYDKANRMVLSQDGAQRTKSIRLWSFYSYDALNRIVVQGEAQLNRSYTHSEILTYIKDQNMVSKYSGSTANYGYTLSMSSAMVSNMDIHSVNYYDNYSFRSLPHFADNEFNFTIEPGFTSQRYGNDSDLVSAKGLLTGSIVKVFNTFGATLASVSYYDMRGNLIQSKSGNLIGGYEKQYMNYSFTGKSTWTKSVHTSDINGNTQEISQVYTFEYDHAERPTKTWYKLDNYDQVLMSELVYDEVGRVSKKRLHETKDIDYKYNVRGWIKEIYGDYYAQTLYYEDSPYTSAEPSYNGNVSAYDWWFTNKNTKASYLFHYDGLNRLIEAEFARNGEIGEQYYDEKLFYDKQGNISELKRNTVVQPNNLVVPLDHKKMTYNGNQLVTCQNLNVDPNLNIPKRPYSYNANGSMILDPDRGISNIEYNSLNLPQLMEFEEGYKISYSYDASGAKRRVVHTTVENVPSVAGERTKAGVVTSTTTDYAGGIVYEDGEIKQILTSEGYITPEKIFTASSVAKAGINIPQIIDTLVKEDIIDAPIKDDFNDNGGIIIGPKPKQPIPMRYHYFIKDYIGNVRSVIRCNEGSNTFSVVQHTNYYPFGMPWETSSGQEVQPYKREGKEYDEMYGLNMYDQGARLFGAELPRTMTIDPLAEKYYNISPYAQWGNNPVKYVDPTGMAPIYDLNGYLLGTDDNGLQGDAIFMNKDNFTQSMSPEDALNNDLGMESLLDQDAIDRYMTSFEGLSSRPDWDGYLTLAEANDWYQNGNGEPLFVDLNKIDLSGIVSYGENYVGDRKYVSLFTNSLDLNAALVYGTIELIRFPNHQVRSTYDIYDFDMHQGGGLTTWLRNRATEIGEQVAGQGTPYKINFNGSKTLNHLPWVK